MYSILFIYFKIYYYKANSFTRIDCTGTSTAIHISGITSKMLGALASSSTAHCHCVREVGVPVRVRC